MREVFAVAVLTVLAAGAVAQEATDPKLQSRKIYAQESPVPWWERTAVFDAQEFPPDRPLVSDAELHDAYTALTRNLGFQAWGPGEEWVGQTPEEQYAYIMRYLPGGYAYRGDPRPIRGAEAVVASRSGSRRLFSPLELSVIGGFVAGPSSGKDPAATLGASAGPGWLRFNATGSWIRLRKDGTPGGYLVGGSAGADVAFRNVFIGGGVTRSFADQEVWTKRVHYAYGDAGIRWAAGRRERGVPKSLNEVRATYFRETFSTYANRTEEYRLGYIYDGRFGTGPWCFRLSAAVGKMYFDDNPYPGAGRRSDMSSRLGVGISFRP